MDESTLERMLATGQAGKEFQKPPAKLLDANDEFEVYERAAPQGVRETVRESPPPDTEEYPPRQHQQAPQAPQPQAPQQPAPLPPAPPQPVPYPHPTQQPEHVAPADPGPSPQQPAPPQAPSEHVQAPAQYYVPQEQQQQPPAQAPPPAPAPEQEAPQRPPARPQVFSLQKSRPAPDSPAPAPQAPARQGHGGPPRIALVQADYNSDVTDLMAQWAIRHVEQSGAELASHIHVPGVFDVPLATKLAARRPDVDAVVVVGAVIQGETGHDELIAREAARLLADIAYGFEKPVGLGIAGPRMTLEQAEARIMMGRNAVESVLRQLRVLQQLQG